MKGKRICAALLALVMTAAVLIASGSPAVGAGYSDAKTKNLEEQIAQLQQQEKQQRAKIAQLQNERSEVSAQKKELDELLATTQRIIENTETLFAELDASITDKREQIESTQAEYARVRAQFLETIATNYEEGEASYIGLILGADSLGDFLSRVERVSSILEYNNTVMSRLDQAKNELLAQKDALEELILDQAARMEELENEKAQYEKDLEAAIALMNSLSANEAKARSELAKRQAEEAELDKQLQEYIAEQQRKLQAKMEVGDWQWPIDLTVQQYGTSGYGWRILFNQWDFHRGWDIACWLGNDIHAAKGGTVLIATYHYSYGNYVVIDHGDGVSTVYGHASKLLVTAGQKVQKGDVIAKVGTTGNSTGYHLHFEFRLNGQHTDPFNYIKSPPISVYASKLSKG